MASGNVLGRMLIPAAVALVFVLARKYMPARPQAKNYVLETDDQIDNGSANSVSVSGATVLMMVAIMFPAHALLVWLNQEFALADGTAAMRLFPQAATWWFLPGFGAVCLAYEIVVQLWSLTTGRASIESYDRTQSEKAGFDGRRLLRWMGVVVVPPLGLFTVLALPEHASLGPDAIFEHGYGFKGTRVLRYADARRLTAIDGFRNRDGKFIARAGLVLNFVDGSSWSSADWGDFQKSIDPQLADFLVAKTGLRLGKQATVEEIGK